MKTKPGPKKGFGTWVDLPPVSPPGLKSKEEIKAYQALRQSMISSPFCSAASTEAIEQAARLKVRIERLRGQVEELESDLITPENGVPYIHPLVRQLNLAESNYRVSLGALCLTPKSVASSRIPASQVPQTPVGANSGEDKPTRTKKGKPTQAEKNRARVLQMMGVDGAGIAAG